ncbi:MAG: hypothetical protein IM650_00355 [Phenylobacterium sp.]|uniref:hypothetical protein n=1 Tax=Phenylobacterium sp. TaxID=1871053 RepID=UPI0025E8462B|nr:hypothetical protein [Phenylobacterium sp.]MCA3187138.1 hypothetical protein [Cupriavidus sp.]MCA6251189.1 hypothetical protein [Phenylobacterium sp.]MCA6256539.1 hypothetical protein [Phenylobacterium sp.]
MDKETAKILAKLLNDAADTIETLLDATPDDKARLAEEAKGVTARLKCIGNQIDNGTFAALMKRLGR